MGTWNAFYVRAGKDNGVVGAAIRATFPAAAIEATAHFLGVRMPDEAYIAPESELAALSSKLATDVMWLGFQSTVDAFQFHHWQEGRPVRSLVYGCFQEERTWERVEGAPEPWEREAFFSQSALEHVLKYAGNDRERDEFRRIWRDSEILPGRMEPGFDARECAHQIAAHYRFPHYGPQE